MASRFTEHPATGTVGRLCAAGKTVREICRDLNLPHSTVWGIVARKGFPMNRGGPADVAIPRIRTRQPEPVPAPAGSLTPQQEADVGLLCHKGGYSREAAIAVVIRPKVKIRMGRPDRA